MEKKSANISVDNVLPVAFFSTLFSPSVRGCFVNGNIEAGIGYAIVYTLLVAFAFLVYSSFFKAFIENRPFYQKLSPSWKKAVKVLFAIVVYAVLLWFVNWFINR